MNASWLYKTDNGEFDERGEPVRIWFTYDVGSMATSVSLATNQYSWEGEQADTASGVLLEKIMPIDHPEAFMASEYDTWSSMCALWSQRN